MSKDKGSKNHKKAPADKTKGKSKAASAYKSEEKGASPTIPAFAPKPDVKTAKPPKA